MLNDLETVTLALFAATPTRTPEHAFEEASKRARYFMDRIRRERPERYYPVDCKAGQHGDLGVDSRCLLCGKVVV